MCCGSFLGGAGSGVFFAGALPSCCFGAAVSTPILLLLWCRCLRVGRRLAPEGRWEAVAVSSRTQRRMRGRRCLQLRLADARGHGRVSLIQVMLQVGGLRK